MKCDHCEKSDRIVLPRSGSVQPCAAANGGGPSRLPSPRLVAAVAELGSLGAIDAFTRTKITNQVERHINRKNPMNIHSVPLGTRNMTNPTQTTMRPKTLSTISFCCALLLLSSLSSRAQV